MYVPFHDERARHAIRRVSRSFGIAYPDETRAATVGQLIDYVAHATPNSPDAEVPLIRYPSQAELRGEAFRQLQAALEAVDAQVPDSIDTESTPAQILPRPLRRYVWRRLSNRLECDLPPLQPTMWRFGAVWFLFYFLSWIAATQALGYALGSEWRPTTVPAWIGILIYVAVVHLAGVLVASVAAELGSPRHRVPFSSVAEMVDHVRQAKAETLEETLSRPIEATLREYVVEVVAEEFGLPPGEIGPDFSFQLGERSRSDARGG